MIFAFLISPYPYLFLPCSTNQMQTWWAHQLWWHFCEIPLICSQYLSLSVLLDSVPKCSSCHSSTGNWNFHLHEIDIHLGKETPQDSSGLKFYFTGHLIFLFNSLFCFQGRVFYISTTSILDSPSKWSLPPISLRKQKLKIKQNKKLSHTESTNLPGYDAPKTIHQSSEPISLKCSWIFLIK